MQSSEEYIVVNNKEVHSSLSLTKPLADLTNQECLVLFNSYDVRSCLSFIAEQEITGKDLLDVANVNYIVDLSKPFQRYKLLNDLTNTFKEEGVPLERISNKCQIHILHDGSCYEGEMKDGLMHGYES